MLPYKTDPDCLTLLETLHPLIYYTHYTIPSSAIHYLQTSTHNDYSISLTGPRLLWDDHPQTILAGQEPSTPGPRSCGSRVSRDEGAKAPASLESKKRAAKPRELERETLTKVCLPRLGHWTGLIHMEKIQPRMTDLYLDLRIDIKRGVG